MHFAWKCEESDFKNRRQMKTVTVKHICRAADSKWLLTQTVSLLLHQTNLVFKGNLSSISDANYFTGITIIYIIWSTGLCFTHWIFLLLILHLIFSRPQKDVTGSDFLFFMPVWTIKNAFFSSRNCREISLIFCLYIRFSLFFKGHSISKELL